MTYPTMIPSAPPTSASVNSSKTRQRTIRRAETPSALSVRRTGRRCSNARPTEPCTIARPTANDRSPNAVRFRWKLSVRRPRSLAVAGGLIASSGARDASSGRSTGWTGARNILLKPVDVQQFLRGRDVGKDNVRSKILDCAKPVLEIRQPGRRCRAGKEHPVLADQFRIEARFDGGCDACVLRNGERVHAKNPYATAICGQPSIDKRAYKPASPSKGREGLDRNHAAIGSNELGEPVAAENAGSLCIGLAGFCIDCLHSGPERGGERKAQQERRQLERASSPVGQQRSENRSSHSVSFPWLRCIRRSAAPARRME